MFRQTRWALVAALTLTFAGGGADAGADHNGEDGGQFAMLRVGFHDAGSAAFRIGFTACTQRSFMNLLTDRNRTYYRSDSRI